MCLLTTRCQRPWRKWSLRVQEYNNVDLCLLSAKIDVMMFSYIGVDYLEYACTCIYIYLRDFRISGGYMTTCTISGPINIAYPLETNLKNECAKT